MLAHSGTVGSRQAGRQAGGRLCVRWGETFVRKTAREGRLLTTFFFATPELAQGEDICPLWEIEMVILSSSEAKRGGMLLYASPNLDRHVKPIRSHKELV